ncbi:hypothetical protein M9Y10_015699 [Tritrichomonas musculus]|uniref:Major facilitator superfamily transporter n=1 Tax=Tritrichomonas musculus TaxID=1915356 RepID=A0ABR2L2Y0_9EUKA
MIENQNKKEWIPLNKRDHLSFLHICGIAAGTLVANLLWKIIFTLFEPISEKVSIKQWIRTLLLFYGSLAGFVINPILGVYSDTLMFRYGRRRIFMLGGSFILILGLLLMIYCQDLGQWFKPSQEKGKNDAEKGIFIVALLIVFTAGNIIQNPARTLCSDVTPPKQQVLMANICEIYAGVGGILTNLVGGLKLYQYVHIDQESFILIICLSLSAVCMVVAIIVTPEEPLHEKPPTVNPFKQIWTAIKKMPKPFLRVLVPFTFGNIANYQFGFQFSHFMGHDIFKGENNSGATEDQKNKYQDGISWAMMCYVVYYTFQFIYGFVSTWVIKTMGMRVVTFFSLLLLALGFFSFFFVSNKYAYLGIVVPLGLGNLVYNAVAYAIVSLVIPTEDLAANFGVLICFGVFGQQVSNFGIGSGLGAIWPDNSRMMIGLSSIFAFIGAISAFFMINPREDEAKDYQAIKDKNDNNHNMESNLLPNSNYA